MKKVIARAATFFMAFIQWLGCVNKINENQVYENK